MADVPSSSPPKIAKGGLSGLKKLPPWAWILIIGGGLLLTLYLRHNAANKTPTTDPNATDPNATNPTDPNANYTDPGYYNDPTGGLGYGISDPGLIGASGGLGGGTSILPAPAGPTTPSDPGSGGTSTGTAPSGGGITNTFSPTVTNSPIITGGGAPARPTVHSTPTTTRPPKPPDPKAGGHYVWNNGKWNLIHWDNKKKKWVPGPVR